MLIQELLNVVRNLVFFYIQYSYQKTTSESNHILEDELEEMFSK